MIFYIAAVRLDRFGLATGYKFVGNLVFTLQEK